MRVCVIVRRFVHKVDQQEVKAAGGGTRANRSVVAHTQHRLRHCTETPNLFLTWPPTLSSTDERSRKAFEHIVACKKRRGAWVEGG